MLVFAGESYINDYKYAFVALGNPELRNKWINKLVEAGYEIPTIIHPTAYNSPSSKIGTGSFIGAKAVVNANAVIKEGCIIGIGALVDHDSRVLQYSYVNAGAVIKAGCTVESFEKIDAGMVYSGELE